MDRTVTLAIAAAGAIVAGAAAGLLVARSDALAEGTSADDGPYGQGSGVTPPAAQGTRTGAAPNGDRERDTPTTSGAEAQRGRPYVPGTGVGTIADQERARAKQRSERAEGDSGAPAAPSRR